MKLSGVTKLSVVAALLALGSMSASAALIPSCSSVSGDTLSTIPACQSGDLIFSNFQLTAQTVTGDSAPDPTSNVFISFETSGNTTTMIATYSSDPNALTEYNNETGSATGSATIDGGGQTLMLQLQYSVTENTGFFFSDILSNAIAGSTTDDGSDSAVSSRSDICTSGTVASVSSTPNSAPVCTSGSSVNVYTANHVAAPGDPTVINNMDQEGDDLGFLQGNLTPTIGVYDEIDLYGGTVDVTDDPAAAGAGIQFNTFTELPAVPEPGTLVLIGGSLIALGAIRRRKRA